MVRRKGRAVDEITWQTRTARLLVRHLAGRTRGPVFATDRVPLAAADLEPDTGRGRLSYRRAAELFTQATGGWTLHDPLHSALTHAAEDGMPTPMLMTKSGRTSIRALARYSRPSVDALARRQDQRDPTGCPSPLRPATTCPLETVRPGAVSAPRVRGWPVSGPGGFGELSPRSGRRNERR